MTKFEPYKIAIADAELDDMRFRLARTRWADDLGNADWRYGVERGWLEEMVVPNEHIIQIANTILKSLVQCLFRTTHVFLERPR